MRKILALILRMLAIKLDPPKAAGAMVNIEHSYIGDATRYARAAGLAAQSYAGSMPK